MHNIIVILWFKKYCAPFQLVSVLFIELLYIVLMQIIWLTGECTHSTSKGLGYINYCLNSTVSITLHCQLCSAHYTAVWQDFFEKYLCSQSSHYEKYKQFLLCKGSHHVLPPNWYLSLWAKMSGTQSQSMKNALYVLWIAVVVWVVRNTLQNNDCIVITDNHHYCWSEGRDHHIS